MPRIMIETDGKSFDEIRAELHSLIGNGKEVECPTCDKHCHVDVRGITDRMARELVELVIETGKSGGEFIYRGGTDRGGMSAKLRYWDLIEKGPDAAFWRATPLGEQFVRGEVTVVRKLFIYNNTVLGIADDTPITFKDCLEQKFDLPDVFSTEARIVQPLDTGHTRD